MIKSSIKRRMKFKQSQIELWEAIKELDSMNPIKIIYNKQVLYNDYDSTTVLEILPDGEKIYGEKTPPDIIIPIRFPELLNKRVYNINIEIVEHHHSILTIIGE